MQPAGRGRKGRSELGCHSAAFALDREAMTSRAWSRLVTAGVVAVAVAAVAYLLLSPRPEPAVEASSSGSSSAASDVSADPSGEATSPVAPMPPPTSQAEAETAPTTLPVYDGPVRDRARADLLREALTARLAVGAGDDAEGAMPAPDGSGNQASAPLGRYVAKVMEEQFAPLATSCYEQLLARKATAAGAVELEFSIAGDRAVGGVVLDVALGKGSTLSDAEFSTCITESMYAVVFDAPPDGHPTVTVTQSFEFAP